MHRSVKWTAAVVCLVLLAPRPSSAAPVTWEYSGYVSTLGSSFFGASPSDFFSVGDPWSLRITFDPDGPHDGGIGNPPCDPPQAIYGGLNSSNALSITGSLTVAGHTATYSLGTIGVNVLADIGCGIPWASATNGLLDMWLGAWSAFSGLTRGPGVARMLTVEPLAASGLLPNVPSPTVAAITTLDLLTAPYWVPSSELILRGSLTSVRAVPEPSVAGLLSATAVAMLAFRRRLRRPPFFRQADGAPGRDVDVRARRSRHPRVAPSSRSTGANPETNLR